MKFSLLLIFTSVAVIIGGNKVAAGLSYYLQNSQLEDDPDDSNSLPENPDQNGIKFLVHFSNH